MVNQTMSWHNHVIQDQGVPTSSVLPKSILQKPNQDQNLQLDTPGPDCEQIRASTRAHLNAKQRGLDPPGHPLSLISSPFLGIETFLGIAIFFPGIL